MIVDVRLLTDTETAEYRNLLGILTEIPRTYDSTGWRLPKRALEMMLWWCFAWLIALGCAALPLFNLDALDSFSTVLALVILMTILFGGGICPFAWMARDSKRITASQQAALGAIDDFLVQISYERRSQKEAQLYSDDGTEAAKRRVWYNDGGPHPELRPSHYYQAKERGMSAEEYVRAVLEDD